MEIVIRTAGPDDYEAAVETVNAAFLEHSDARSAAVIIREIWDADRTWLAWDGDRVAGTFRSWATELTVPGGAQLSSAAVAGVTVLPTHRRRGIMSAMAAREHAAIRERGEAAGLLYAAEYPIYGRLGYSPGTWMVEWTVDSRSARMLGERTGTVSLTAPSAETRDVCRAVFERWQAVQPGEIRRNDASWDFSFGIRQRPWEDTPWRGFVVLHHDPTGSVDGYARYTADGKWEHGIAAGMVQVEDLHALTQAAEDDLVRFLLEIDLVTTVKLGMRRIAEPFLWRLHNQRAARLTAHNDGMWVRLFDVPRALETRSYERSAGLVIEVVDDPALAGTARLALDAGPDGATCTRTSRSPDLTLPVAALGGAYLGGTRLVDLARTFGADEHRPGALAKADALLRTADPPWCSTFF